MIIIDDDGVMHDVIPKDQYEQRLKADMVAMLTEIMGDITDHAVEFELFGICDTYISVGILQDIIYKKVNALKGEQDVDR